MTTRTRLFLAVIVSAGLHALLIPGGWLLTPSPPAEQLPLEARLVLSPPAVPSPAVEPAPVRPPAKPPAHRPPPSRATPVAKQAPAATPAWGPPAEAPAEPSETIAAAPGSQQAQAATPPPATAAPPAPVVAEPPAVAQPASHLPRKGTITFALTGEGFNVGRAVQSWEVDAGGYRLASDAETTGIVDMFRPQRLRWLSKGKVTQRGLRPESFLVSRTRRGQTEASEAQFDWKTGSLTYGSARDRTTATLPGDTQDIMSFIYQLAIAPPSPGRYRLPITTGTKFETYDIDVRAEEEIETPLGTLRALPVRQRQRPGVESIEIWLAERYHYLPVKIRYFNREGNPAGEQVASDIRVSED